MALLITLLTTITLLASITSAFPTSTLTSPKNPTLTTRVKRCTSGSGATQILPPTEIITFDLTNPSAPGVSPAVPLFFQYTSSELTFRQLLRFDTPSSGTCSWILNLPAERYDASNIYQKTPEHGGPVHLSFSGVDGSFKAGGTIGDVKVKPGPYGVVAVKPGEQVIHSQPCSEIGTDVFVRVPEGNDQAMQAVWWVQDVREVDEKGSLGFYMKHTC